MNVVRVTITITEAEQRVGVTRPTQPPHSITFETRHVAPELQVDALLRSLASTARDMVRYGHDFDAELAARLAPPDFYQEGT